MNKKITLSFTQDEVEIISQLLRLEEQERQQQFANTIGDEELSALSLRVWGQTTEGKQALKEAWANTREK